MAGIAKTPPDSPPSAIMTTPIAISASPIASVFRNSCRRGLLEPATPRAYAFSQFPGGVGASLSRITHEPRSKSMNSSASSCGFIESVVHSAGNVPPA